MSSVPHSECEFIRNGSAHDSEAAAAHLTSKLDYLVARDRGGLTLRIASF